MTRPAPPLGLPRRVVGLFLLFNLAAVASLTVGAFLAARALLASQATGGALASVGRLAAAVRMDHVRGNDEHVQDLLDCAKQECRLAFAAVVGVDGVYLSHTDRSLVGAVALDTPGDQLRWGEVDGVRYMNANGEAVNEYHSPLSAGGKPLGTLRVALVEPGASAAMIEFAHYAPLLIVVPAVLVVVGGWSLSKLTHPVAGIEAALARVARTPYGDAPHLEPIPPSGIASVGWNRLVEQTTALRRAIEESQRSDDEASPTLRASSKAEAALASLGEGIVVTDADGRIDFANRAVEVLLGDGQQLASNSFVETLARLTPATADKFQAGPQARVVAEAPLALGDEGRTLRVERIPLRGAEAGHVWAVRDVTQQKLAEAARDQFIDAATHELRTPLANIKAFAETLSACDISDVEQQKEFCNTINSEATRLARFVDDLLSISSLEVGSLGLTRTNTDVRRLVEEAAEKVRPLARTKSIAFETSLAEKLGEASLDKDKVSSLLVNLLGNAAKYTPAGGTITLAAVRKDQLLEFEVRDTGVGIAPEECERVFEKFFRSENPAVRDEVGTGLGLPLAREIARLHRGDVTLASTLGQGSTFTVTLPVS